MRLVETPDLEEFKQICSRTVEQGQYPQASKISHNIPIYDAQLFDPWDTAVTNRLQDEWYDILSTGPGVFVLKNMYTCSGQGQEDYTSTLEATNAAFQRIIEHEKTANPTKGDHFAAGGKNDRIWNSFSKHAAQDPGSFLTYYANPWLSHVSEAWLGPSYRVTAQCNIVKPGGKAQDSHRDYHLGFQEESVAERVPRGLHLASQFLTLQGAVAHSEMPVESGPTRFLPFSQCFQAGYLAYRREEFRAFFQERFVASPLELGDGVFFNPGLFHAAGENCMSSSGAAGGFDRKANLLQVSCAFGKPMEMVDTVPVVRCVWDGLVQWWSSDRKKAELLVKALAEGYPFPTNLDKRPPAPSGMAPESEQDVVRRGLDEDWGVDRVTAELEAIHRDSSA